MKPTTNYMRRKLSRVALGECPLKNGRWPQPEHVPLEYPHCGRIELSIDAD